VIVALSPGFEGKLRNGVLYAYDSQPEVIERFLGNQNTFFPRPFITDYKWASLSDTFVVYVF
jgi:hypothetical protein